MIALVLASTPAFAANLTITRDDNTQNRDTSIYLVINDQMIKKPLLRGQSVTVNVPSNQSVKIEYAAYVQHNLGTRSTKDASSPEIVLGKIVNVTEDVVVNISPTSKGFTFN